MTSVVSGAALCGACATGAPGVGPASPGEQAGEHERLTLELRAKNAGYVRRIEELENRIFILEDQLDSRRLAAEQRAPATLPKLATRVLRPAPANDQKVRAQDTPAPPVTDEGPTDVQTSIIAEHAVDYAGDALRGATPAARPEAAGRPRPLLRLSPGPAARVRTEPTGAPGEAGAPEPRADFRMIQPAPDPLGGYREALESLRGGRADRALVGFRRFLEATPHHDYADNAQYWIGECHYDQRQFRAAERAFRNVVERYPRGNKVPDAMLKLGFTLQSLGDEAGGRSVLESLARAFPKHQAARLASERLAHPEPPPTRGGQPAALGNILPLSPAAPHGGPAPGQPAAPRREGGAP